MNKLSMKKMLVILVFATIIFKVSAFDFGGTLNNTTKYDGTDFSSLSFDQKDSTTIWIRAPFNNEGTLYLAAEGTFQYEYVQSSNSNLFVADCDLFKFGGIFKLSNANRFLLSVGRFIATDSTGLIFTQACDGVLGNINLQRFSFSFYGGYTGFLNAQMITELNSADSTYTYDSTSLYPFAAPYAIGGVTFSAPYLFANQSVSAQFYGFFGTPGINYTTTGYNRIYGTIALNGPLSSNIFYTMTTTFTSDDMFSSIGNLSQIQIGWYPSFKSSSISAKCVYASGNNGFLSPFVGFTSNPATVSATQPQYTGLLIAGLSASIKPVASLYFSAGADCVLGCPEETITYNGFQYNATIRYQALTDVQVSILANQYFSAVDTTDNKITFTAKAVISF